METKNTPPETQASRRIKYGLNVAVAAVAAVALVVLLNWVAYRQYVRFDLTATRKYSLSEQTEKVLRNLEGDHRVVTLFRVAGPRLEYVRDLIGDYAGYGSSLRVEHIDPDLEIAKRDAFLGSLLDRYQEKLQPTVDAVAKGREALTAASQAMAAMVEPLREAAANPDLTDPQYKEFLASLQTVFMRQAEEVEAAQQGIEEALAQPLPEYPATLDRLRTQLQQIDEQIYAVVAERFTRSRGRQGVPSAVQDRLLGLADEVGRARTELQATVTALRDVAPVEEYTELVESLSAATGGIKDAVIVVGPQQVRVIDVAEMFREPDPSAAGGAAAGAAEPEMQFVGEERLTGALLAMSIEKPAMVVFVAQGQQPALGDGTMRGQYDHVASRLRAANFRVEQWQPGGGMRMGPMGPMPAGNTEPPVADEGQKTIWVLTPTPVNPQDPMSMMQAGSAKGPVADALRAGLEKGDAALVMLASDTSAAFQAEDPIVNLLDGYGIKPQLDRVIFREVQVAERGQTQPDMRFAITRWGDALPVTAALGGMPALFMLPTPIVVSQPEGVQSWPLVKLSGDRLWAETGFGMMSDPRELKYDPAEAVTEPVVAAAAQKGDARVIVTTAGGMPMLGPRAPNWASDGLTLVSALGAAGEQLVEAYGAAYPANAELFVNSVYWLAGLDQLIAASPRSQDIRRIGDISEAGAAGLRWGLLAGVPLVIATVGVGVWAVRRRG